MPVSAFQKFNSFVEAIAEKVHKLDTDTLNVMLTNTAPVATNTVKANLTDITAVGTDYPAGGKQATLVTSAQTSGTYKLILNDVTFGPVTASVGPFQYAVLYNNVPQRHQQGTDRLVGQPQAPVTLTAGQSFVVDFDGTTGVIQLGP